MIPTPQIYFLVLGTVELASTTLWSVESLYIHYIRVPDRFHCMNTLPLYLSPFYQQIWSTIDRSMWHLILHASWNKMQNILSRLCAFFRHYQREIPANRILRTSKVTWWPHIFRHCPPFSPVDLKKYNWIVLVKLKILFECIYWELWCWNVKFKTGFRRTKSANRIWIYILGIW